MAKKNQLINGAKSIARGHNSGTIQMLCDGKVIGTYDLPYDGSIDMKSPEMWARQCICFGVELKGKNINNVELKHIK